MAKADVRLPRGMRDILPQKMIQRRYVIGIVEQIFERFGFEPLQTPALELSQTLLGKYGPDAEKLIYDARHRDGTEDLALRYDLSVPLSRVAAMYPELVKPFKRYQIAPVWRAERPQKGRYREFYQCDADIVGTKSMLADAEIIAMIYAIMNELGFKQFVIELNNRKILTAIGEYSGFPDELLGTLYRAIDKKDKIGIDGVRNEIENSLGMEVGSVGERIIKLLETPGDDLASLRRQFRDFPIGAEGIDELEELQEILTEYGIKRPFVQVDFSMVRGLEYYTGPIFETVVTEPQIGSLTGGGRYDDLIGMFSKQSLPATGTSFGIERIIDAMDELKMFPPTIGKTVTLVLVIAYGEEQRTESLRIAGDLREAGINTEVWFDLGGWGKALKYASAKGIPYALLMGEKEESAGVVTLRDLNTGEQQQVPRGELAGILASRFPKNL